MNEQAAAADAATATGTAAGPGTGAASAIAPTSHLVERSGAFAAGGFVTLRVDAPRAHVRVEPSGDDDYHLHVEHDPQYPVSAESTGAYLFVRLRGMSYAANEPVSAAVVLRVPRDRTYRLDVKSASGWLTLAADNLVFSSVRLTTGSGEVLAQLGDALVRRIAVTTTVGPVEIDLPRNGGCTAVVATKTGDAALRLGEGMNARVRLSTRSGRKMVWHPDFFRMDARTWTTHGSEGPAWEIGVSSLRGNLQLLRLADPEMDMPNVPRRRTPPPPVLPDPADSTLYLDDPGGRHGLRLLPDARNLPGSDTTAIDGTREAHPADEAPAADETTGADDEGVWRRRSGPRAGRDAAPRPAVIPTLPPAVGGPLLSPDARVALRFPAGWLLSPALTDAILARYVPDLRACVAAGLPPDAPQPVWALDIRSATALLRGRDNVRSTELEALVRLVAIVPSEPTLPGTVRKRAVAEGATYAAAAADATDWAAEVSRTVADEAGTQWSLVTYHLGFEDRTALVICASAPGRADRESLEAIVRPAVDVA